MLVRFIVAGLFLGGSSAQAANGIAIERGADSMVYGNCVLSLVVENRSTETIGYLQIDVLVTLESGEERTIELKSAYREGVRYPVGPGANAILRQHLDTSPALGAPCTAVKTRHVVRTICETVDGKACASPISVQP